MTTAASQLGRRGMCCAAIFLFVVGCGNDGSEGQSLGKGGTTGNSTANGGASSASGRVAIGSSAGANTGGSGSTSGTTAPRNGAVATPELILGDLYPTGIATDGTNLFWSTLFGELFSRPLAGGAAVAVKKWDSNTSLQPMIGTASGLFALANHELNRCSAAGTCEVLASEVDYFAVEGNQIYWNTVHDELHRMPLGGGTGELLFTLPNPWTFGVHNDNVYYDGNHKLYRRAAGGDATMVTDVTDSVSGIAFDDAFIYLVLNNSKLVRMGLDGSDAHELLNYADISNLRVVNGYLYFLAKSVTGCGTTNLNRYSPTTGRIESLLTGWTCIHGYALAGNDIYFAYYSWSKSSDSALYRMPLP